LPASPALPPTETHPHDLLLELYAAATRAVDPMPALAARLAGLERDTGRRPWLLALGKAAEPMARQAVDTLARSGIEPAGGLAVPPAAHPAPHPRIRVVPGDHPEPGARSLAAAEALARIAGAIGAEDEVWVLLSGGASSLLAGVVGGQVADALGYGGLFATLAGVSVSGAALGLVLATTSHRHRVVASDRTSR